jgi:hypothetical protein
VYPRSHLWALVLLVSSWIAAYAGEPAELGLVPFPKEVARQDGNAPLATS